MRGTVDECPRCGNLGDGRNGVYVDELYDARGIYCGSGCEKCMAELERQFRPEVLTDPDYECCEAINDD